MIDNQSTPAVEVPGRAGVEFPRKIITIDNIYALLRLIIEHGVPRLRLTIF